MNELLDTNPNPITQTDGNVAGNFNVIIPHPWTLAEQSLQDLDKINDECMDKLKTWESRMSNFFKAYFIITDSWRIRPNDTGIALSTSKQRSAPKTLFNSKSGETHRAVETLATFWFRMLTASDPYFETEARGLNSDGSQMTEDQLYSVTNVLLHQLTVSNFKKKLMRSLRSKAMVGVSVCEEPFVKMPYGFGQKYVEYTDWVPRTMIRTGFDTSVYDILDSDFIFFIDFFSKWMLRNQASQDSQYWDLGKVETHIKEFGKGAPNGKTDIYSRLIQSRSRAGYTDTDLDVFENVSYHGRLDTENSVIQSFAESIGLQDDPKYFDWSVNVLDGSDIVKFHMTQYGDWRTRAKVLSYKDFEDEPFPYGVGQLGRKLQRNMDISESLADDKAVFDTLNMWKRGAYGGDTKQFIAEPMKVVDLEDVNQLMPLVGDPNVLRQMLAMINLRREDFRNVVGAQTNLQAQVTGASATETAIAQTEAVRGAGVHGELDGEVLKSHLEICHVNNLNYLDEPIWIGLTGSRIPVMMDKNKLPMSVGFIWKVVTDKDFRPEEMRNIIQALQIFTSMRNMVDPQTAINTTIELTKKLFRKLQLNPALISQPVPQSQMMEMRLNRLLSSGGGGIGNEVQGEAAGGQTGSGEQTTSTPMGPVPTSPSGGAVNLEMSA